MLGGLMVVLDISTYVSEYATHTIIYYTQVYTIFSVQSRI
jgi:hypothetical protein